MAQIVIDYNTVMGQANDIGSLSDELRNEISKLESLLGRIKSEWCGLASDEFQGQLQKVIADIRITSNNMLDVSGVIKDILARLVQT